MVLIAGNHDHYRVTREALRVVRNTLSELSNVHWLHDSLVEIQGKRFLGTPMWFRDSPWNSSKASYLSDFDYIPDFHPWVYAENARAIRFLEDNVRRGDIVITHHLPTARSVAQRSERSELSCFYVCDMEYLIARTEPALWVHGHTHDSADYEFMGTRIVCNPYGYCGTALNSSFVPQKVVIVE